MARCSPQPTGALDIIFSRWCGSLIIQLFWPAASRILMRLIELMLCQLNSYISDDLSEAATHTQTANHLHYVESCQCSRGRPGVLLDAWFKLDRHVKSI